MSPTGRAACAMGDGALKKRIMPYTPNRNAANAVLVNNSRWIKMYRILYMHSNKPRRQIGVSNALPVVHAIIVMNKISRERTTN